MKKGENVTSLKKGVYIVTDPCYILGEDNDKWGEILDTTDFLEGYCKVDGNWMFGASTQYGDGQYTDKEGRTYSVDAGMLSAIPMALARKFGYDKKRIETELVNRRHAQIVKFDKDFECSRDGRGIITFGHIVIKTGDEDEDEDN